MDIKKKEDFLYVFDFISSMLALCLTLFCLYLIPYLFFGAIYDVPKFVVQLSVLLQDQGVSGTLLKILFLIPIVLTVAFFVVLGRKITGMIDMQHGIELPTTAYAAHDVEIPAAVLEKNAKKTKPFSEHFVLLLSLLIAGVIGLLSFVEYLIVSSVSG